MASDPYWSSVELFLTPKFSTDGSIVVRDLSTRGNRCVIAGGVLSNNPVYSSIGSIFFSANGNLFWYGNSFLIPAAVDFCVEYFFRFESSYNNSHVTIASGGTDAAQRVFVGTNSSGRLYFNRYGQSDVFLTSGAAYTANTKHHFRMARSGGVIRYFLDGALVGSNSDATAFGSGSGSLIVGGPSGGYISGIRFTKGVARTTAAFTPPDDRYSSTNSMITGVVRDAEGVPASRLVRAYWRETGVLAGADISDAATGIYNIGVQDLAEVQRIVLDDAGGTLYNDLIDRVIPV